MPVSTAAAVRARSLRRLGLALTLGLLAGLFALSARAQAPPISAEERREAVEQIGRLLDAQYVFPDVGRAAGQHLAQQLAAGAYDDLADAEALAARLTEDLQSISRDRHMRVRPAPMMRAGGDRDAAMARMRREQRAFNYGFARVERLEGNVGYLDLRGMAPIEEGRETAAAAMRLLEGVDALIVDLRQNGGGDPRMVQFLSSYLFGERT
ncbi:MAG TPA: S41 family peptidase, partial [Rubricoccaceae bacterium]|nr:S41 family peptidase [Rubricoccaceae bacterium]